MMTVTTIRAKELFMLAVLTGAFAAFSGAAFADQEQRLKDANDRHEAYGRKLFAQNERIEQESKKDQIQCGTVVPGHVIVLGSGQLKVLALGL